MRFCAEEDPLLDYFLRKHRVNLLALPRTGVELGTFFVLHKSGTVDPIPMVDLIEPAVELPDGKEETIAGLSRKWSEKINIKPALSLHRMFLAIFGAGDQIGKIGAVYAQRGAHEFRLHIPAHKRECLSVQDLQTVLKDCQLRKHPQVDEDVDRLYVSTAVWRAPGLVFDVTDKDGKQVKAAAPLKEIVDAELSYEVTGNSVDHVIWHDKAGKMAAFGVELMLVKVIDGVITLVDQRPAERMRDKDSCGDVLIDPGSFLELN